MYSSIVSPALMVIFPRFIQEAIMVLRARVRGEVLLNGFHHFVRCIGEYVLADVEDYVRSYCSCD